MAQDVVLVIASAPAWMQDDRPTKLLRLSDFRRGIPHVSQRALTAILERVKADGVPALTTRKNKREARDMIAYESTPYGPLKRTVDLRCHDGSRIPLHIVNLHAILYHVCSQGGFFADIFKHRLQQNPCDQLHP